MTTPVKPSTDSFVWSDSGDKVEPSAAKKLVGFEKLKKPARQFFNFLINRLFKWAEYLHLGVSDNADLGTAFYIRSGFDKSSDTGLNITMNPGEAILNGGRVITTGTTVVALVASNDNYIHIDDTGTYGVVSVALGAFPPSLTVDTIRVRKAVTDGTDVVSEVDLRSQFPVIDTDSLANNFLGFEVRDISGAIQASGLRHLVDGIDRGGLFMGQNGMGWLSSTRKGINLLDPITVANALRTRLTMDQDVAWSRDFEQAGQVLSKDKMLQQHYDGTYTDSGAQDTFFLNSRSNPTPGKYVLIVADIVAVANGDITLGFTQHLVTAVFNNAGTMTINNLSDVVDNQGAASAGVWVDVAGDLTYRITSSTSVDVTISATVRVTMRDLN